MDATKPRSAKLERGLATRRTVPGREYVDRFRIAKDVFEETGGD
jgi:hypothetical protein